ncbi:hypothetical protein [Nostoc sp.]|uniref:hypothetical protein n=1 Tax=Nostoc sp. TaxID=1180 RepID=UPI002FFABBF7
MRVPLQGSKLRVASRKEAVASLLPEGDAKGNSAALASHQASRTVIARRRHRLPQTDTPLHPAEHSSSTLFNITCTSAKFLSV